MPHLGALCWNVVDVLACQLNVRKMSSSLTRDNSQHHSAPGLGKLVHWQCPDIQDDYVCPCVRIPIFNSTGYLSGTSDEYSSICRTSNSGVFAELQTREPVIKRQVKAVAKDPLIRGIGFNFGDCLQL